MTDIRAKKLYHFTKIETAIRFILPERSLRLNKLINMNDPKENLIHKTNYNEAFRLYIFLDDFELAKKVQNETNVLAFSVDRNVDNGNNKVLIKGYQLQRMWAQYGGNNTGVCLLIDYDKFIEENKDKIAEKKIIDDIVSYDYYNYKEFPRPLYGRNYNERPSIESIIKDRSHWDSIKANDKLVKERFFSKNIDWQGESEYRFLSFENLEGDPYLSIENSLEKVILGINASRHFLPSIIDKVGKEKVFHLDLDMDGQFELKEV